MAIGWYPKETEPILQGFGKTPLVVIIGDLVDGIDS
jgi:hypothetical protein